MSDTTVEAQANLPSGTNAYPRPDLHTLSRYLKVPVATTLQLDNQLRNVPQDTSDFLLVTNLTTGDKTSFGTLPEKLEDFETWQAEPVPYLVFLRGHASAKWLEAIVAKFRFSPELFQRHIHWKAFAAGARDLHTLPALPSSNARIFQLMISTICQRNDQRSSVAPEDLEDDRRQGEDQMKHYFRNMRNNARDGDSLVRKYRLISKQDFVIQQKLTIEVVPGQGGCWRTFVWLDNGRDLAQSVPGPWMPHEGTRPWETYVFPIILQTQSGPTSDSYRSQGDTNLTEAGMQHTTPDLTLQGSNSRDPKEWRASQNICQLPLQYGPQMNRDLARQDALYVLSDLFRFAASSELQLLNLLRRRIESELSFAGYDEVDRRNAAALINLRYIMKMLNGHARRLAETIGVLRNRGSAAWPAAADSSEVDTIARSLIVDYEYLLERAKTLVGACQAGMDTLAASSVLEETRRSTDNAMRLQKLTIIATVFIPLSFVCSVWGMNFKELGSGNQSLWMYAATAVPVILLSLLIYFFDILVARCGTGTRMVRERVELIYNMRWRPDRDQQTV